MNNCQYNHDQPFILENGFALENLSITYHTSGKLNDKKDNVIWICHALTANSDVFDWWAGLFGEDELFNPQEHFIICANVLGSSYGTTNPTSINPQTGKPYLRNFPLITIRDMAKAHQILAHHLEIKKINVLIGGSLGGQQALEFSLLNELTINHLVLLATNAVHSPWGIAFNESQRLAIEADESFFGDSINGGSNGLIAARTIAMLSYRTYSIYQQKQKDEDDIYNDFKASSYQRYQGEKLTNRFNAHCYWKLTKAMDSHNIARDRGSLEDALHSIQSKTTVIGISTDLLFPLSEQKFIADHIPGAKFYALDSNYGHDGFLVETEKLKKILQKLA